jgi:hypothetical protein
MTNNRCFEFASGSAFLSQDSDPDPAWNVDADPARKNLSRKPKFTMFGEVPREKIKILIRYVFDLHKIVKDKSTFTSGPPNFQINIGNIYSFRFR